jgi:hypothetical protein
MSIGSYVRTGPTRPERKGINVGCHTNKTCDKCRYEFKASKEAFTWDGTVTLCRKCYWDYIDSLTEEECTVKEN